MNYNGQTTIEFHINRIKDLQTDQYRVMRDGDDPEREEELLLEIEGRSYFTHGRHFGLPEDCYPDEGETEILSITWKDGKPFPWELTDKEKEEAEEQICLSVQEDEPDPPSYDYDDDDFDDYEPDYDPSYDD